MKATGLIRRIDDLGRIVIPKDIRRTLHLKEGDPMEIWMNEEGVTFKPYRVEEKLQPHIDALNTLISDMESNISPEKRKALTKKLQEFGGLLEEGDNTPT